MSRLGAPVGPEALGTGDRVVEVVAVLIALQLKAVEPEVGVAVEEQRLLLGPAGGLGERDRHHGRPSFNSIGAPVSAERYAASSRATVRRLSRPLLAASTPVSTAVSRRSSPRNMAS